MPSFSLSDLIPEPIVYIDDTFGGEGRRHDMRTLPMFSAEDYAAYTRLQRDVGQAQSLMAGHAARNSAEKVERAMQQLLRILDEMLLIVMPDFPRARLEQIPTWAKQKIIEYWRAEQKGAAAPSAEAQAVGEAQPPAQAVAKTPRGRRSPASAGSTRG